MTVARKLCFVVDYRSPHARHWIESVARSGNEVHVVSTYPARNSPGLASLTVVPVGLSFVATNPFLRRYAAATEGTAGETNGLSRAAITALRQLSLRLASVAPWFAPMDVLRQRGRLRRMLLELRPDMVHAMRLPYEGFLAAEALRDVPLPLLISTWGSDLVLFAERYPLVATFTRRALRRADAVHSDCKRDVRLAKQWGLAEGKPTVVLPGGGGVRRDLFYRGKVAHEVYSRWGIPPGSRVVFNPRNFRPAAVRTEELFEAVGVVQRKLPNTVFLCAGMEGNPLAVKWRERLPDPGGVRLLPLLGYDEMADIFRMAHVTVSPSVSDGMPNSLLEAMACGSLPVAGDLDSVREWIVQGENGLFCDPVNPASIAEALERGLTDEALRQKAATQNAELIERRADSSQVMACASRFYDEVVGHAA